MDEQIVNQLKKLISGTVAVRGDEVYESASKMFVRTVSPAVVVRPVSNDDLSAVVRFAKEQGLPLAIRSGGHGNTAKHITNEMLLIDMRELSSIEVIDNEEGLVRVGAGATWYAVANEMEGHGLAISSGDTRTVGVGGLTTGAGLGWMVRKYGPLVDNTIAAEVVTADGEVLEVSNESNPDLFWAIRGGGSNFGIVTHFVFKAAQVSGVSVATLMYSLEKARDVVVGWRDAMRQAPPELTTMLNILPSMGDTPASVMIRGCFEGTDKAAADRAYAPFIALDPVHFEITSKPYKEILEDAMLPPNMRVIVHDTFLKEFTDDAVSAIVELCQTGTPPILQVRHVAGAMNDRAADATAFSHRDSELLIVNPTFVSPKASDEEISVALTSWRTIEPFGQGVYLNFLSENTGQEIAKAYLPATLERLKGIKAKYDPDNIFDMNYNIAPLK